jgi:hypothetical protein
MTTQNQPTPQPPPEGQPTPQEQPAAAVPSAPAAAPAKPADLEARVRKTVGIRTKERELQEKEKQIADKEKSLAELASLGELAKKSPSAALRKLLGVADGEITPEMTAFLKGVSQDLVGVEGEEKAYEALPPKVRAKLERVAELEKLVAAVPELQKQLDELRQGRDEALQQLTERQQAEAAQRIFSSGIAAVATVAEDLPLLSENKDKEGLIGGKWAALLQEKSKGGTVAIPPEEAQALVLQAAKEVEAELQAQHEWVLNTKWARGKLGAAESAPQGAGSGAPSKHPAPSTPGRQPKTPRTGTPGSMGEPSSVDFSKLPYNQRIRALQELERTGRISTPKG